MIVLDYMPTITYTTFIKSFWLTIIRSCFTVKMMACIYIKISFINHYTVPTSQSEVTVMQSDDNQPRQDDESSLVEHTNGSYIDQYM